MTYSTTKPDPGPAPDIDYLQIQTNFSVFNSTFSSTVANVNYNHTKLNDQNQGDHESIILQLQSSDPAITGDYDALYAKNATSKAGTQPQLFVRIPQFLPTPTDTVPAPNTPMLLTYNAVNTSGPQYQSFLAGGYLIYFGSVTGNPTTVTLSPVPTKILNVIATPTTANVNGAPYSCNAVIKTTSTFTITGGAGSTTFNYMAIALA